MLHVITGGSGSGKSRYAEQQILDLGPAKRIYIATMHPYDEESFRRIDRHRAMRAEKEFDTLECYTDLKELEIPEGANVLLECMSNLTANEMFEPGAAGDQTVEEILKGIRYVLDRSANLVVVTNEICSDGIDYDPVTRQYQQYLGQINQAMAEIADRVTEVVYGIPLHLKNPENKDPLKCGIEPGELKVSPENCTGENAFRQMPGSGRNREEEA